MLNSAPARSARTHWFHAYPAHATRKRWLLAYQDALGTPEEEILDRTFISEAEALAWANSRPVVPLWLEERDELIDLSGRVIGVSFERHDI